MTSGQQKLCESISVRVKKFNIQLQVVQFDFLFFFQAKAEQEEEFISNTLLKVIFYLEKRVNGTRLENFFL